MKIKYLFSIMIVVAVLVAATGARAATGGTCLGSTSSQLPSPAISVQRSCQINISQTGSQSVTVVAGPGTDLPGGMSKTFPSTCPNTAYPGNNLRPGPCQCDPSSQSCFQWTYQWTMSGNIPSANLTLTQIGAGSDVSVYSANPSGAVVVQPLISQAERFIQWSVNGTNVLSFTGSYYTPVNVRPGTVTAGFAGNSGNLTLTGRCAIAGAEFVTIPQNQAVPAPYTRTYTTAGGCGVSFQVDPTSNKAVYGTAQLISGITTDCNVSETTSIKIDTAPAIVDIAAGQWTEEGSCSYCFVNTYGGKTCCTCTTCTIKNGVCSK